MHFRRHRLSMGRIQRREDHSIHDAVEPHEPHGVDMAIRRVPLGAFGIAFGLVGLSGSWRLAAQEGLAPAGVGNTLLATTGVVWLLTLVGYGRYIASTRGALRADLCDDVGSPFASLAVITPTLLAAQGVAPFFPTLGLILVDVFAVLTMVVGGLFIGHWIHEPVMRLSRLHPGYFLPTVAGGLVAAIAAATVGQQTFADLLLGLGLISWLIQGAIIRARLIYAAPLPSYLAPTLAIEVAPPAAASLAYFAINGGHIDRFAAALAGYGVLMVLAQMPLVPRFSRLPFAPSFWSFAFSWAAVASTIIVWMGLERPAGYRAYTYVVLTGVTLLIGTLGVRTLVELARGRYFPSIVAGASGQSPSSADSDQTVTTWPRPHRP